MAQKLAGKVALVTGGSRGIGAAIVRRLAADGASVAFTFVGSSEKANETVQLVQKDGGRALAILADASDPSATQSAVAKTAKTFGGLDILVNSAGLQTVAPIDHPSGRL